MCAKILGIESSCDETSAALIDNGKILANIIANQKIHEEFGGVVPELASRAHQQHIVPVIEAALKKAQIDKSELDAIAFTCGPGLIGSLLVGASFAKTFALALDIPLISVNHMHAHILAHFIEEPKPEFPFICLTVSGGHTQLVLLRDHFNLEVLGETIDDAAGEAFDKTAKMIGLPYPGGPEMDRIARYGDPNRFEFAEPTVGKYEFSFSGLKTSVLYFVRKQMQKDPNFLEENKADLCASIQSVIVNILLKKLKLAANEHGIDSVAIAGGVSANSCLRARLTDLGKTEAWKTYVPEFQFCTDNAAMIAKVGELKYQAKRFADQIVEPKARYKLEEFI